MFDTFVAWICLPNLFKLSQTTGKTEAVAPATSFLSAAGRGWSEKVSRSLTSVFSLCFRKCLKGAQTALTLVPVFRASVWFLLPLVPTLNCWSLVLRTAAKLAVCLRASLWVLTWPRLVPIGLLKGNAAVSGNNVKVHALLPELEKQTLKNVL